MQSVFSTPPPNIFIKEAAQIIYNLYEVKTDVNNLTGDRDQNFLCVSGEKKFILKISNPAEDRSIIEMQNKATHFIRKRDPKLKIPLQIGDIKKAEK